MEVAINTPFELNHQVHGTFKKKEHRCAMRILNAFLNIMRPILQKNIVFLRNHFFTDP